MLSSWMHSKFEQKGDGAMGPVGVSVPEVSENGHMSSSFKLRSTQSRNLITDYSTIYSNYIGSGPYNCWNIHSSRNPL